jgi:uncharacterized protein YbjQ (UPF0145 family)
MQGKTEKKSFSVLFFSSSLQQKARNRRLRKRRRLLIKCVKTMILSTTPTLEGHSILEYKGVVTGETIIGANIVKDFFASIRDVVGGRSGSYEQVLREAKDSSLREMSDRAAALGANAIVGIDIDYETIGESNSMIMVAVSGTAVLI